MIDWWALGREILAPSVPAKTAEQIDEEEAAAIDEYQRRNPSPKWNKENHLGN